MNPHTDPAILATLPPVLRGVVKALGLNRARQWLIDRGGVNITLPMRQGQGLSQEETKRLRQALADHMDGTGRIWLPKADKLLKYARDQQIRIERHHQSINKLARHYHLSSRQIVNICNEETNNQQGNLF